MNNLGVASDVRNWTKLWMARNWKAISKWTRRGDDFRMKSQTMHPRRMAATKTGKPKTWKAAKLHPSTSTQPTTNLMSSWTIPSVHRDLSSATFLKSQSTSWQVSKSMLLKRQKTKAKISKTLIKHGNKIWIKLLTPTSTNNQIDQWRTFLPNQLTKPTESPWTENSRKIWRRQTQMRSRNLLLKLNPSKKVKWPLWIDFVKIYLEDQIQI